jgi:hypothetical protein
MTYNVQLFVTGLIYQLALMRITRLINADTILDPMRLWIVNNKKRHESVAHGLQVNLDQAVQYEHHRKLMGRWSTALYFVQCPWCVGMWLALLTSWAPVAFLHLPWWSSPIIALAASHVIGICARFADTEEIDYEDETVH